MYAAAIGVLPTYMLAIGVEPILTAMLLFYMFVYSIYSHVSHAIYYSYKLSTNNNYRGVTIAPY